MCPYDASPHRSVHILDPPSRGADVLGSLGLGLEGHDSARWLGNLRAVPPSRSRAVRPACPRARQGIVAVGRGAAQRLPRLVLDLFHEAPERRHLLQTSNQRAHSRKRRYWYQHFTDRLASLVLTRKSGRPSHRRFDEHLAEQLIE